ncbi:3'5'-cyclic nucleotide phosphodiesterase family protein [Tritrichomonas foetus]|uniref:3'5'-cyclic nucleotide phosphodiesterase family protein n=1 Tax=Tritrichomonas foetus TaxID=1144522 RepID=A0A1J4KNU4_9EUKA|nr:3'5'-cyclic nucleotide phosphodiesterase family protein [Tritrichomonas foetus]|eukprot:OHT11468.1 3'5'-cyclic nucleotide phosphodiesterase family protein [Tritrichomonas foetus]
MLSRLSHNNVRQIPGLINKTNPVRAGMKDHRFVVNSNGPPSNPPVHSHSFQGSGRNKHINPPQPEQPPEKGQKGAMSKSVVNKKVLGDLPAPSFDSDCELDIFLNKAASLPLNQALEAFFKHHFNAKSAYVWQEVPNLQILYCHTLRATAAHSSGLVGYAFFSRSIVKCPSGPAHPSYISSIDEKICPLNSPVLLFPLYDWKNNINYIVEVIKPGSTPEFTSIDEEFTEWFTRKFKILSRWLKPLPSIDALVLDIMQLMPRDDFLKHYQEKISAFYDCRTCEIWKLNKSTNQITQYSDKARHLDPTMVGVVGDAISREQTVNVVKNRLHNSYNSEIDGNIDEAVLAVPVLDQEGQIVYCIVLRGPKNARLFTKDDEDSVRRAAPIILLAFTNCDAYSTIDTEYQDSQNEREGLAALLEVVEVISSQLDTGKLTEVIMEKGRLLTDSDRCSLFLVNESRDRLITSLHHGLENAIDIPINKGIAGKTVMEARILNIADVYETDFFDSSTDLETGYRTRSILSVPIYNNRGEVIGVTEMVNKKDEKPFSQWDQKLIQIFNVFCGISLENARLFKESLDMSSQLRSFFDISFAMAKSENIQRILSDIMQKAKKSMGADRASLYLLDEANNVLSTFISDCDKMPTSIPLTTGLCSHCAKTKETIFVNDAYNHPKFNRTIDNLSNYKTKNLLVTPIQRANGELIGVVEMVNKTGDFVNKDIKTAQAFGTFAAIALENNRLKDLAHYGDCEIEINKWVGESEKNTYDIPKNLTLTEQQIQKVSRLNCFAVEFKGIDHFKELFYFYHLFDILRTFKITNEAFFRFIFTISGTYNPVPYHNWTHACDVTQYITYEIKTAGLENMYTKFELFGILTAAVCHDANHEGFNNIYNVKAETPFGILYKDQSVMEMHHITVAIPIITRDDINLFHALSSDETKKMWNLFVSLILATDMAHHFELVKKAQAILDENDGKIDFEVPENRLLSMQLILKVGDISNVSRPFEIADKWCDILNNEFFRQGDLEKKSIGLTSPLNDRDNSDKPKSQIGFYNFICIPLYNAVAKMFTELTVNVESLKSNLETWKGLAAQNAPPPEKKD